MAPERFKFGNAETLLNSATRREPRVAEFDELGRLE